jgi:hypothetical protein
MPSVLERPVMKALDYSDQVARRRDPDLQPPFAVLYPRRSRGDEGEESRDPVVGCH